MKQLLNIAAALLLIIAPAAASAQKRVVDDVKRIISSMTVGVDQYKLAQGKIKPALSHDETKDNSETWLIAGKVQFGLYDKYMAQKSVGKTVDALAMGHAIIDGYAYMSRGLQLDSIKQYDKNGQPKIDRKTGLQQVKTKHSDDIMKILNAHIDDFNATGAELYNVKDWDGAYLAWDIYCKLASGTVANEALAEARYFQAIAAWQKGDMKLAVELFAISRELGLVKKEGYDYALVCLSALNDEAGVVELAREAYEYFGDVDPQYARIMINDYINRKDFVHANQLLDEVIATQSADAELQNLKGLVVEQSNNLESALPYFERAVQLDANNAQAVYNVARYYYNTAVSASENNRRLSTRELKKIVNPLYEKAMPLMEKAYELDPTNTDAREALRAIYYRLNMGTKLNALEKAN